MRTAPAVPARPFRWDLTRPDQLGTLVPAQAPDLWFRDALVECAAKVFARSGGGDLVFVGRSGDSLYDLLTGLLDGTGYDDRLHRFPFSSRSRIAPSAVPRARAMLAASGFTPATLTARRPVAFVDLVCEGGTFEAVYVLVRDWALEERAGWSVIRRKVHFTGIVERDEPSPHAERWWQDADWPCELRRGAVRNVAVDRRLWRYLGEQQPKLTRSFRPDVRGDVRGPRHDDRARAALAEALAVVAYGRTPEARAKFVRTLVREPAIAQPWLRTVVSRSRCSRSRGRRSASAGCTAAG